MVGEPIEGGAPRTSNIERPTSNVEVKMEVVRAPTWNVEPATWNSSSRALRTRSTGALEGGNHEKDERHETTWSLGHWTWDPHQLATCNLQRATYPTEERPAKHAEARIDLERGTCNLELIRSAGRGRSASKLGD